MGTNNACNQGPTQYNVQTGGANGTLNNVAPSSTSGVPVISQGASSQPIFGTAVVAGGGTGSASFTAYGPVVAASTTTGALTSVAPSSTSGVPFISQGASANPAFGTAVVAGGGTGLTTTTAYGLIAGGTTATGNFQNVGTGSSGQILKSLGSSSLPSWVAPAGVGGSLVLLQSQDASSSASLSFTSGISSTYQDYLLLVQNYIPATNATDLYVRISTDGGGTFLSTGYNSGTTYWAYNSTTATNANTTSGFLIFKGAVTTVATHCVVWLSGLTANTSTVFPQCGGTMYGRIGGNVSSGPFIGEYSTGSTNVNAIQVISSSGNLSSGKFTLYGLATS